LSIADEILAAVEGWANAWSSQDVDAYLATYSPRFQPPGELSRRAWETQRRERLTRPSFIAVTVAEMNVRQLTAERVVVEFDQSYRSDSFGDRVRKTLELVKSDGSWLITREVSR
jgi:adhesin transport system outer membrane protein